MGAFRRPSQMEPKMPEQGILQLPFVKCRLPTLLFYFLCMSHFKYYFYLHDEPQSCIEVLFDYLLKNSQMALYVAAYFIDFCFPNH